VGADAGHPVRLALVVPPPEIRLRWKAKPPPVELVEIRTKLRDASAAQRRVDEDRLPVAVGQAPKTLNLARVCDVVHPSTRPA
jgi:hypothetical protein